MASKPKYRIKKDDVHVRRARPSSAANDGVVLSSQRVYGTENSIMFAERGPGYHTRPHRHAAEQMNYIVSGEIWFFVEGNGYRCKPGDFMRVPKGRVHWAYNRGTENSIMFAERGPGYHTRPHRHQAEQMNYIVSGEIWFFVEGNGYRCKPGDFMRVPKGRVHWAYNRGTENCVIIESHCPPLIGNDAEARKTAEPLLGPDEDVTKVNYIVNEVVPMDPKTVADIEARALAEEG